MTLRDRLSVRESTEQVELLHNHRECSLLRVGTSERHPSNVERMRECSESLSPNDPEVSGTSIVDFCEASIHDVGKHGHAQASYNGLTTLVELVRNIAECE